MQPQKNNNTNNPIKFLLKPKTIRKKNPKNPIIVKMVKKLEKMQTILKIIYFFKKSEIFGNIFFADKKMQFS